MRGANPSSSFFGEKKRESSLFIICEEEFFCVLFFHTHKKKFPFFHCFPSQTPLLKNKLESLNEWTHTDAFLGKRCATRARALWWYDTLERDDFDDVEAEEEQQPPRRPPLFDGKKEEREIGILS